MIKKLVKGGLEAAFRAAGFDVHLARRGGKQDLALWDRNAVSWHYNADRYRKLYEKGLDRTGMRWSDSFGKQARFYTLMQMVERAVKADPTADAAECGCWKGHSTFVTATLLKEHGFTGRFHVFDSFEGGLSDLGKEDKNERYELSPEQVAEQKALFASTENEVRRALEGFDFISLYKGWIPTRFNEVEKRRFSFVHIDVDLYDPIRDSLAFFWPRVVDGGVVVVDDYGFTQFPGAKKATDEFLARNPPRLFYACPTGGAFILK